MLGTALCLQYWIIYHIRNQGISCLGPINVAHMRQIQMVFELARPRAWQKDKIHVKAIGRLRNYGPNEEVRFSFLGGRVRLSC